MFFSVLNFHNILNLSEPAFQLNSGLSNLDLILLVDITVNTTLLF